MIGKTSIGKSFGGCIRYVMDKDKAEVLEMHGVYGEDSKLLTEQFNMIRKERQGLGKAVWHTSISFSAADQVSDEQMKAIAKDYLQDVGLADHQYLLVKHTDTQHPHFHIVANRVGFDGKVASDKYSQNRTARACDKLEKKYQLTIARNQGKKLVQDKVPVKQVAKSAIQTAIAKCLKVGCKDFSELEQQLKPQGITIQFQKQSTGRINGISFRKNGLAFKGSSIHKNFSYGRLTKSLNANLALAQAAIKAISRGGGMSL